MIFSVSVFTRVWCSNMHPAQVQLSQVEHLPSSLGNTSRAGPWGLTSETQRPRGAGAGNLGALSTWVVVSTMGEDEVTQEMVQREEEQRAKEGTLGVPAFRDR